MAEETAFQRALRERRVRLAEEAPPVWDEDLVPEREAEGTNEGVDRLEAMRHDPILDIYRRLIGGKERSEGRDEVKVQCPMPDHPDNNPSANVNTSKNTWTCYACAVGGSVFDMAGAHWGYPFVGKKLDSSYMWEVKKRYGREVHGFDYDAATAPAPAPASMTSAPTMGQADPYQVEVTKELNRLRIREDAKRRFRDEQAEQYFSPLEDALGLDEELNLPTPETKWTIEGLHQVGDNSTIIAGFKTGKTTTMVNLLRCLADGDPFLGQQEVRQVDGRIAFFNLEVTDVTFRDYVRPHKIRNASKVKPYHLRGRRFDLMDDRTFQDAVDAMKRQEIEVIILDPYAKAFYGDQNSNSEVGAFTRRLDEFKAQAGIVDLFMPVHTGHGDQERARGASELEGWADSRWTLTNQDGVRYLKANGRLPQDFAEVATMINLSGLLVVNGTMGSRKVVAARDAREKVLEYITANPGCNQTAIRDNAGVRTEDVMKAIKGLLFENIIEVRAKGRATLHYLQGTADD